MQRLVSHEFDIQSSINELKSRVIETGRDRIRKRVEDQAKKDGKDTGHVESRTVSVPSLMSSAEQIEDVIRKLETAKAELAYFDEFELRIEKE